MWSSVMYDCLFVCCVMGKTDFDCKVSRFYETEALTVYVRLQNGERFHKMFQFRKELGQAALVPNTFPFF